MAVEILDAFRMPILDNFSEFAEENLFYNPEC
jgi:hypothetical protein